MEALPQLRVLLSQMTLAGAKLTKKPVSPILHVIKNTRWLLCCFFSSCCDQRAPRNGLLWLSLRGHSPSQWGKAQHQICEAAGHVTSAAGVGGRGSSGGGGRWICSLTSLLLFIHPRTLVPRMALPTFRFIFQPQSNLLEIPSPTARDVLQQWVLSPVKLTMINDHHTWLCETGLSCTVISSSIHFPVNNILLISWIGDWIVHCAYKPRFLYPFICWGACRLIPN